MKLLCALLLIPSLAFAVPAVPITLVVVNDSAAFDVAEVEALADSAIALLPGIKIVRAKTFEIQAYCPVGEQPPIIPNSVAGWKPILCPSFGARGGVIVIVQPRGYTIGFSPGVCTVWSKCSAVHVNIDLADPRAAIIAIAHEIGHALGATNETKCSLMSSRAIISCGKRGTKITKRSKEQIRSCLREAK